MKRQKKNKYLWAVVNNFNIITEKKNNFSTMPNDYVRTAAKTIAEGKINLHDLQYEAYRRPKRAVSHCKTARTGL